MLNDETQRLIEDEADCRSVLLLQTVFRGRTFANNDRLERKNKALNFVKLKCNKGRKDNTSTDFLMFTNQQTSPLNASIKTIPSIHLHKQPTLACLAN